MTFVEFIQAKPDFIRLGQWFVINYWGGSYPELYYESDEATAMAKIIEHMEEYNWSFKKMPIARLI